MKNNFARISKILHTQSRTAGFTLIELLVAMSISVILVSITGFGLVAMMTKNSKAEGEILRRTELNRALDFITDEVRMANNVNDSTLAPAWAWKDLGSVGSPSAILYLQIPWLVVSMPAGNSIPVKNNGLDNGNAVMFTGSGTMPTGLSINQIYYVRDATKDTFNTSLTLNGIPIPLTSSSSGFLILNKLIIYYIRDNPNTWLGPKTIYRSTGDCSTSSNCDLLIDSIAVNGFTATAPSSRQAVLNLLGQLSANSTDTYPVSTSVFARSGAIP